VTAEIICKRTVAYSLRNCLQKLRRFIKNCKKKSKVAFLSTKKKTNVKEVFTNNSKAKDLRKE
jgi:hypothetical protein